MKRLSIDLETYSSVNLMSAGLYKYVQSPDFEILLFGYSVDGVPVACLDLVQGDTIPSDILAALTDERILKTAYNASFEWYCLSKYLGLLDGRHLMWLTQWRDTMLHSLYCGYPAGLGACAKALNFAENQSKMNAGKALIRYFCVPCNPTKTNGYRVRNLPKHDPEKWQTFKNYNAQDVVVEMAIETVLSAFPVPADLQDQWVQDMIINERGVAIDTDLVNRAIWCNNQVTDELTSEAIQISGLDNPGSIKQLQAWLTEELDEEVSNVQKATVKDLLSRELNSSAAKRILEIRQELGKTSVSKYDKALTCSCADNRIRGLLQFYGANRTGRWAGRLVQVQNLPRTYLYPLPLARELTKASKIDNLRLIYGAVPNTLSQLIRTAFVPANGHIFIDADFSAIEARVISWLADEQWRLEVFRTHGKIYEASASQMFGVPLERIAKGNPEYALRAKGKVAELALGYQGASGALVQMGALTMGLSEEELPDIVSRWRSTNKRIQDLWYSVENAVIQAIKTGVPVGVCKTIFSREFEPISGLDFLTIKLPSGRKLFYAKPFLTLNRWGKESIGYYGVENNKWQTFESYGGKLVENITQAIARDCLAFALTNLEAAGYRVVFHVHDEVIIEEPYTSQIDAERTLSNVCIIMSQPPKWADGLPLNADGWVGDFFTKD